MFVQSARFVENHKRKPVDAISIFGQEKVAETVRLCKMNLAVHGLSGDIRQGNSYYEDIHRSPGKFDFVMANPPFNVGKVDEASHVGVSSRGATISSASQQRSVTHAECLRVQDKDRLG